MIGIIHLYPAGTNGAYRSMTQEREILTLTEASKWVNGKFNRRVTPQNITYLIQYGQIRKLDDNGVTKVYIKDLKEYYSSQSQREIKWKKKLGEDLNWKLSFDNIREKERTKHVHRLHPYKGKFIPQLVKYFLDDQIGNFKKQVYFQKRDIVLDPFCGSGTALVQANELGMHAIGIDISEFNSLITNVKVKKHNLLDIQAEIIRITQALKKFVSKQNWGNFEEKLLNELGNFNYKYFPAPEYRYKVRRGEIDQSSFSRKKEIEFLQIFNELVQNNKIKVLQENDHVNFLDKWYLYPVRQEINFVHNLVNQIKNKDTKDVITIILSRTIRSCRATTHADLATLKNPISSTYYCRKHYKICKPLFSILSWWERYSKDTINRLVKFEKLRTNTYQYCMTGDSRTIDIFETLCDVDSEFADIAQTKKIKGIFSSPPYVGLINYHEQHAYAYDLFNFERRDKLEIGPLFNGKGHEARRSYVEGISKVLINCKKYLASDFNIFLVANDRFNLYPKIANNSGLSIVNKFKRPVLNRTEKDKSAYSESIFHLKKRR